MSIPDDFLQLLPGGDGYHGPLYVLWVFDPVTARVTLESNDGKHPADHISHPDLAGREGIFHPSRVEGYAYHIQNGWRITDSEHRPVEDPFIINEVLKSLRSHATL
jgi:hypothetical protein